jgi:hypothetical protein
MVIFGKSAKSGTETSIDIRDTAGGYSQAFSILMKDYYLNPHP